MFNYIYSIIQAPLFNILFLVAVAWSVAIFLERYRIPIIIGELMAGIIIGPAVLNIIRPSSEMELMANLGMFFLMFYAGLETNPRILEKSIKRSFPIALGGTFFPFVGGTLITLLFGGNWFQALMIGAAISGTSMVTKARILDDLKLIKTPLGYSMMGASLVDNIFSFVILAGIIRTVEQGTFRLVDVAIISVEVLLFFGITLGIGYILFPKIPKFFSTRRGKGFTFALLIGFSFAVLAEAIHLPFIIGAYLAGLFVREEIMSASLFRKMNDRFLAITHGFFGPIFIMSIALKLDFSIIIRQFWFVAALIFVAFVGKLYGIYVGARVARFKPPEALIMGICMNGRGTVELVIAAIGLRLGIINSDHLSALVIVAFATTLSVPIALNYIKKHTKIQLPHHR